MSLNDGPSVTSSDETDNLEAVQVFREPVITPSGLSYEQSALQEHLSKVSAPLPFSAHLLACCTSGYARAAQCAHHGNQRSC